MSPKPGPPLRKITLNLQASDIPILERVYGRGWTERIRWMVHEHVAKMPSNKPKTLEDLQHE